MSMSTHVTGITQANNPDYIKHKKVVQACVEAKVSLPEETARYFDVDSYGSYEDAMDGKLQVRIPHRKWSADMQEGFEIDVSDIPDGVKTIRFWNSY